MLKDILNRFRKSGNPGSEVPPGMRLYAIGDIHGRADLLENLAEKIGEDLADAPDEVITIFLGDYVDRGTRSADVVERLCEKRFPTPFIALRGNHEEILLKFLDDESVLDSWRKYGGLETLHSYGVDVSDALRGQNYGTIRETFLMKFPEKHRLFLESTRPAASFGDYFFCHAGVKPGVALEEQRPTDLLWIREEFLAHSGAHEKVIVHGHTPVESATLSPHRINLDTGAYASSLLTALALEGASRRLLSSDILFGQ